MRCLEFLSGLGWSGTDGADEWSGPTESRLSDWRVRTFCSEAPEKAFWVLSIAATAKAKMPPGFWLLATDPVEWWYCWRCWLREVMGPFRDGPGGEMAGRGLFAVLVLVLEESLRGSLSE